MQSGNNPDTDARESGSRFRPDIEGLRAIAIVAVLLCHAGVPFLAGGYVGVDVFFVISGFLITRLLLGELDRHGTISLRRFYARRAKRLLPLSAILLLSVGILSFLILSPLRSVEVSGDIVSSALYVANWHFAAQSVDYFSQGLEPSPVLHLWSLAIEEQFYVVWPGLILFVTWFSRRRGYSVRPALWVTLAVILAGSLIYGISLTEQQPAFAYFSTFARAWELGLGAALALLGAVRLHRPLALALGWAGLAAIVYACFAYTAETAFPGTAALIPCLGAAALILCGSALAAHGAAAARADGTVVAGSPLVARSSPGWLLSLPPVRYVGRISYSWYLWHWPAIIFAAALFGPRLSVAGGLAAVAVSWIPTAITHSLIEDPVRRAPILTRLPNRALALGLACTVLALGTGLVLRNVLPTVKLAPISDVQGAAALPNQPEPQESAKALRPNPLRARADRSKVYYDGCLVGIEGTNSNKCLYGDPTGKHTIILFGDSHAMQYWAPINALAEENEWRLIALTKAECSPAEVPLRSMVADREYSQCDVWRQSALKRIEESGPRTTVIMSSDTAYTAYDAEGNELSGNENADALQAGYMKTIARIQAAGLHTVLIRDTPASSDDVPSCVSEDIDHLAACAFPLPQEWDRNFDVRAADASPGTKLIDLTAEICPGDICRAVIGNALVYRDKSHLTATFALTLAPWIGEDLRRSGFQ